MMGSNISRTRAAYIALALTLICGVAESDDLSRLFYVVGQSNVLEGLAPDDLVPSRRLQKMLQDGANVNAVDSFSGFTLLQTAIIHGRTWAVNALLDADTRVNARSQWLDDYFADDTLWRFPHLGYAEFTGLHLACYLRHPDIVRILLRAGADPDAVMVDSERSKYLSYRSADFADGRTCLMLFLGDGPPAYWPETVAHLYEYNKWYRTINHRIVAFRTAEQSGELPAEQQPLRLQKLVLDLANEAIKEAAQLHVDSGDSAIVPMLIAARADPSMRDIHGLSAYEFAVDHHKLDVLAYLLEIDHGPGIIDPLRKHVAERIGAGSNQKEEQSNYWQSPEDHVLAKASWSDPELRQGIQLAETVSYAVSSVIAEHYSKIP
jgi:ankyrin repeat protein